MHKIEPYCDLRQKMSDKVNRDVIAELDTASKVTTKYCDMSITMMMQVHSHRKWAVRSQKENCDISRCIRAKLEERFGGTWMAIVGTDFNTLFDESGQNLSAQ